MRMQLQDYSPELSSAIGIVWLQYLEMTTSRSELALFLYKLLFMRGNLNKQDDEDGKKKKRERQSEVDWRLRSLQGCGNARDLLARDHVGFCFPMSERATNCVLFVVLSYILFL